MGECARADSGVVDAGDPPVPDGGGACRPACPPSMQCWCGSCVRALGVSSGDGRVDPSFANCGACGQACDGVGATRCGPGATSGTLECFCGDHAACMPGEVCVPDATATAFVCVDTMSNPDRCGPLGTVCGIGEACVAGVCSCGAPGHHCLPGDTCFAGACGCGTLGSPCPVGTSCNGIACVDTSSDPMNCGAPFQRCGMGETCSSGTCHCGAGGACMRSPNCAQLCCAGTCVENTVEHCGTCANVCADGLACVINVFVTAVCQAPSVATLSCPFGAPRSDALCVGVDCSALDTPCETGVCDYATGACRAEPRLDGSSCAPATSTCTEHRCIGGACTPSPAADCVSCGPGMSCSAGICAAVPTSLTYDFESGTLPAGWWPGGASAAPWTVTSAFAHGGTRAARAGTITDGQQTQLQMTLSLTTPATLSFWSSVDSEARYDWLRVFVDGVVSAEWAGAVPWVQTTIPLSVGSHTIEWTYVKDSSFSHNMDTAWIDDVVVMPTTPGVPLCAP